MMINYINKILGVVINTRTMTIKAPPEYIAQVEKLMSSTWHNGRKAFQLKEAETLAGLLGHIAQSAPWLKHLMSHLYTSISHTLGTSTSYLSSTNKQFHQQIKIAKGAAINTSNEI